MEGERQKRTTTSCSCAAATSRAWLSARPHSTERCCPLAARRAWRVRLTTSGGKCWSRTTRRPTAEIRVVTKTDSLPEGNAPEVAAKSVATACAWAGVCLCEMVANRQMDPSRGIGRHPPGAKWGRCSGVLARSTSARRFTRHLATSTWPWRTARCKAEKPSSEPRASRPRDSPRRCSGGGASRGACVAGAGARWSLAQPRGDSRSLAATWCFAKPHRLRRSPTEPRRASQSLAAPHGAP